MREYLLNLMNDHQYEKKDIECLISAYDTVVSSKEANEILNDLLKVYAENINLDYYNEIIVNRAQKIAAIVNIHTYTIELLAFMCMSKHLKTLYEEKNIDMQIFTDSMLDLKWKLEECKAVKGICGSFVAWWFPGFFNMTRYALGRLQFEIVKFERNYDKNGVKLTPDSRVINVHIPRTGTPMDKESCDKAYAQAREFFKDEVGENCPFICYSWLLYPENKTILSPKSNTYRFMSEYDVIESVNNNGDDLWRLFDTDEKDPNKLPTDSSFRRAYVEHLKKGGKVGEGLGVKI